MTLIEATARFEARAPALVVVSNRRPYDSALEPVFDRVDGGGVLVLSGFAGLAEVVEGALLVNPNDIESPAATVHAALRTPPEERRARMNRLRPVACPVSWNAT